ncbi:MAG TPA: hypothetical protein DIT64_17860 [Verrucomicrobiales bacterium]|nr:hypothetical protein [Verrucomicrobiales bacterium]
MKSRPPDYPARSIFICYRRDESSDISGRIYDRLVSAINKEAVFQDIDSMPYGVDFREHAREALQNCRVVLVIIGPGWTDIRDSYGQKRLDDLADPVRIEVETALANPGALVIPVFVNGAKLKTSDVPESLRPLCTRNGPELRSDATFDAVMERISSQIRAELLRPVVEEGARPVLPKRFTGIIIGAVAALALGWLGWQNYALRPGMEKKAVVLPPIGEDAKPAKEEPAFAEILKGARFSVASSSKPAYELLTPDGKPLQGAKLKGERLSTESEGHGVKFPTAVRQLSGQLPPDAGIMYKVRAQSLKDASENPPGPGVLVVDTEWMGQENKTLGALNDEFFSGFWSMKGAEFPADGIQFGSAAIYAGKNGVVMDGELEVECWVEDGHHGKLSGVTSFTLDVEPAPWALENPKIRLLAPDGTPIEDTVVQASPAQPFDYEDPETRQKQTALHGLEFLLSIKNTSGADLTPAGELDALGITYRLKAKRDGSPESDSSPLAEGGLLICEPNPQGYTHHSSWQMWSLKASQLSMGQTGEVLNKFYVSHQENEKLGHILPGIHEVGVTVWRSTEPGVVYYQGTLKLEVKERIPAR